ncbi:hypothetical protein GWK47_034222 [Chionoecetes opilio]|uniref:Uncharacterized protein n=1 Tax=Chionoecetes opilio TaxID=41210 RepID=A0A8J4YP81_CHIOP|nr:hypothetical protein GWK47_034222 [Chionoecetes opilio]
MSETFVNKTSLNVLEETRTDSPVCAPEDRGGPSSVLGSVGQTVKDYSKGTSVPLFSNCDFCPKNDSEPCTGVLTDSMVKHSYRSSGKTPDDHVRVSVADLKDPATHQPLEKHYQSEMLRSAQRISTRTITVMCHSFAQYVMQNLVLAIQNTLSDEDVTLSMAEVNVCLACQFLKDTVWM